MELPVDVCVLKTDDMIECPLCEHGQVRCAECVGTGFNRSSPHQTCPRCEGSGWYNLEKLQGCFACGGTYHERGKGRVGPRCPQCQGAGRTSCNQCRGVGAILLCRALGCYASVEYISKIAAAMEACSEVEDSFFRERGWRLYNVLRSVYQFANVECQDRVVELFPEMIKKIIRESRDRIQRNFTALRADQHAGTSLAQ
jgi:RecJ-like exonuclease